MSRFVEPIRPMRSLRLNATLHGRSVHRPGDVPGHNVFKGYTRPGSGDALDFFAPAGAEVVALADGVQTAWRNDATRHEVLYLEGDGWLAVYAHVNAIHERTGVRVRRGEPVGRLRGDLRDPHLHFELWLDGRAVHAPTPGALRQRMLGRLGLAGEDAPEPDDACLIVAKPAGDQPSLDGLLYNELPSRWSLTEGVVEVDAGALAEWLGKRLPSPAGYLPVRLAMERLGVPATYDLKHMHAHPPRIYVFTA